MGVAVSNRIIPFLKVVEALGDRILRYAFRATPPVEFLSCYAPPAGATEDDNAGAWSSLGATFRALPKGVLPLVAGDLNARLHGRAPGGGGGWAHTPSRRARLAGASSPTAWRTIGNAF